VLDGAPVVQCGDCKIELNEDPRSSPEERAPCPRCGSMKRHVRISMSDNITLHSRRDLKARHPESSKPFLEQRVGDDFHRKTGVWNVIERTIDRARNWYKKKVVDTRTGAVIHHREEPLSDHVGHGSAAKKGKSGVG